MKFNIEYYDVCGELKAINITKANIDHLIHTLNVIIISGNSIAYIERK